MPLKYSTHFPPGYLSTSCSLETFAAARKLEYVHARDQFLVRARSTAPTGHTAGICHHRPPRAALERRFALSATHRAANEGRPSAPSAFSALCSETDDEIDMDWPIGNNPKFKLPGVRSRLYFTTVPDGVGPWASTEAPVHCSENGGFFGEARNNGGGGARGRKGGSGGVEA